MASQRTLVSYLVIPRPDEISGKLPLVPLAYSLALMGGATGGVAASTGLVVWLVFELGLYQVRYLLNDLADADVDRSHVAAESRGRAPDDPRLRRWASLVVGIRLAASAGIIALLPAEGRRIAVLASLGLVGATAAYELARTTIRRRTLADWREARLSPREVAVFCLVGAGYALRVGLGVALAGASGPVVAGAVAFGWSTGIAAITMAWTVEAICLRAGDGASVLARKSHIAVLALLDDERGCRERPLLAGRPARLTGCLFAGSSLVAVIFGAILGGWPGPVQLALLLGASAVAGPLLLASWSSIWAGPVALLVGVAAAAGLASDGGRVEMVAVVASLAAITALFRSVSLTSLGLGHLVTGDDTPLEPAGRG